MKTFIVFSVFSTLLTSAHAGVVSVKLVERLEQQSDTIVVGSIVSVSPGNATSSFQLRLIRRIKGTVPLTTVNVVTTEKLSSLSGVPATGGPTAIWFLKTSLPGDFTLLPAQTGDVELQHMGLYVEPASPTGLYAWLAADSPVDKIVKEAAYFAENEHFMEAEDAMVQSLQRIDTPALNAILNRFAASNVLSVRAIGIASLIQRGRPDALRQLVTDVKGVFADRNFARNTGMLNIVAAIELMYRNPDPAGIQALGALATSSSSASRLPRVSLYALRAIHTVHTLPWLATLLDSPEMTQRYDAMYGIAAFANGLATTTAENVPSMSDLSPDPKAVFSDANTLANIPVFEVYSKSEATYLTFWKNWLTAQNARLQALAN